MRINYALLFVVLLMVAAAALLRFGGTAEDMEQRQYCRMVALFEAEGPDVGWPDYRGSFEQECTPEGGVKEDAE